MPNPAGCQHAVFLNGSINRPEVKDKGWTVELALPWAGLEEIAGGRTVSPKAGDVFRMTAYRCHHDRINRTAKGWTWSVMGNDNIHIPERWNNVVFVLTTATRATAGCAAVQEPPTSGSSDRPPNQKDQHRWQSNYQYRGQ